MPTNEYRRMNTESITRYRDDFARLESQLPGANLPWLQQARRGALDRFSEAGFPTTAREDWKYTNVGMIGKRAFKSAPQSANGVSAGAVDDIMSGDAHLHEHLLVFINGRYAPALSRLASLPQGATVLNLSAALGDPSDSLEALLDDDSQANENGFPALNSAMGT